MHTFSFEAIGTHWQVDLYRSLLPLRLEKLQSAIHNRIEEFESNYSRFRAGSLVNRIASHPGTYMLPSDAERLFSLYQKLYAITNGLFTPFIGNVLVDAGYDSLYSLKPQTPHFPPLWDEGMRYEFPQLTMKRNEILDFGACGKGYLIDIVSDIIRKNEIDAFCVDAGGDIRYEGTRPLSVGLENPHDLTQAIGIATISQTSLCASAGSRRKWGQYHHIVNPQTLASPQAITASWVLAKDTITADAIATCLFLVPPKLLLQHFSFEYLILFPSNSFEKSPLFPAELFLK